jgi:hypothetical protein
MAREAESGAAVTSSLRRLALPGAVAAAGAGIAYLMTNKPTRRLRGLLSKLPGGTSDLVDDLKERVQTAGGGGTPEPTGLISQERLEEFEQRRRERKKRRDRRQKRATT